jgi:hypothetical protein
MSSITWIIIVLIVVSILITVTEVTLRFGILEKNKGSGGETGGDGTDLLGRGDVSGDWAAGLAGLNITVEQLRRLLTERERHAVCGVGQLYDQSVAGL